RQAVQIRGEVNVLLNGASDEQLRTSLMVRAQTVSGQLEVIKPLFLSDDDIHQALHNLGQLSGLAVTPRAVITPELWELHIATGRVLGPALMGLEAQASNVDLR